jgi:hypothetical protein
MDRRVGIEGETFDSIAVSFPKVVELDLVALNYTMFAGGSLHGWQTAKAQPEQS